MGHNSDLVFFTINHQEICLMRQLFMLLLLIPTTVLASVGIRIQVWPRTPSYSSYPMTQQVWVRRPLSFTGTDSLQTTDSTLSRNYLGQRWRRVTRATESAIAVPEYSDETYEHPDPNFGPAVTRNPKYTVQRVYRNIEVTSYNSERRQTDSTPWEIRRNFLVRFGDAACNFLPKGTLFRLPNAPAPFNTVVFRVEDETAAKFGHRIDLWLLHVQHAENWGVRRLTVEVLGPPRGEAPR